MNRNCAQKIITKKSGFTLVEIMIVVAIIALLSAIAIPSLLRAKMSGNDTYAEETLRAFALSLEQFAIINGDYPSDLNQLLTATPPYYPENITDGIERKGYIFGIAGGAPMNGTYHLWAAPVTCGTTGTKNISITEGSQYSYTNC